MAAKTEERVDRKTPNGGAYAIAYFRDEKGDPCEKAKAKQVEIVEFDSKDTVVGRTYGTV